MTVCVLPDRNESPSELQAQTWDAATQLLGLVNSAVATHGTAATLNALISLYLALALEAIGADATKTALNQAIRHVARQELPATEPAGHA